MRGAGWNSKTGQARVLSSAPWLPKLRRCKQSIFCVPSTVTRKGTLERIKLGGRPQPYLTVLSSPGILLCRPLFHRIRRKRPSSRTVPLLCPPPWSGRASECAPITILIATAIVLTTLLSFPTRAPYFSTRVSVSLKEILAAYRQKATFSYVSYARCK